jgi:hypothetical protein
MTFLNSIRSLVSRQPQEEFGLGERFPITKAMSVSIKRHMNGLSKADLSGYTFERRRSEYHDAKSDLVIYNPADKPVLNGREIGGRLSFWES